MTEFKLPELGENIHQGDLVRLMISPGASISEGQPVMELETDKAVVEVPSSVSGTVKDIRVKEGEKVQVGQVIFTVENGAGASAKAPEPARAPDTRAALQLLGLLQREGRLVDFVEEDLAGFPDSAIGAAARTVHAGCKKVIDELFRLEAVYREGEGARVTVAAGFDATAVRLTGNVVGKPPFQGALRHHGWRAREVKLPPPPDGQDLAIVVGQRQAHGSLLLVQGVVLGHGVFERTCGAECLIECRGA